MSAQAEDQTLKKSLSTWLVVPLAIAAVMVGAGFWAFRQVRISSEDKAVYCVVRQLSAAADQYFLENGVTSVTYAQLVGPTNYVKAVNTVAGETYPAVYRQGGTITVTGVAGARTITYAP